MTPEFDPAGRQPDDAAPASRPTSPPPVRASDDERDRVVETLSEHATTGRLTLAELEERMSLALSSTTRDELDRLVADLPAPNADSATAPVSNRKPTKWIVAVMGGSDKKGRWRVGERVHAVAVMGGHTIDLRNAELESDDITIVTVAWMGGTDIYVPDTVDLQVGGFSLMGATEEKGSDRPPRPGAPRVRVLAYNVMGGTDVWRLPDEAKDLPLKEARRVAKKGR